jgi:molecular chaperone DnaK (HSP70)
VQSCCGTFFHELNKSINPDRAVARAAVTSAISVLGGEKVQVAHMGVTPLSLGLRTVGGVMTTLIPTTRRSPPPEELDFFRPTPTIASVLIQIFEGRARAWRLQLSQEFVRLASPAPRLWLSCLGDLDITASSTCRPRTSR